MKQKVLGVPLVAIIALLLIPTIALGALLLTKTVPSTISIIAPAGLTIYEEAACIVEVTEFDFGELRLGDADTSIDIYLKNTGTKGFGNVIPSTDLPPEYATFNCTRIANLPIGTIKMATLAFSPVNVTGGNQTFNVTFDCY